MRTQIENGATTDFCPGILFGSEPNDCDLVGRGWHSLQREVVVVTDEAGSSKLGFEYPDGPVKPRQEKLPESRRAKAKRRSTPRRKPSGSRRNDMPPRGSSVPNVPLVKV